MADVRLTATNPEDSSVVPVACDAAGRLLLEEPQVIEGPPGPDGEQGPPGQDGDPFSGNFAGDVTFGGSAEFAGGLTELTSDGIIYSGVIELQGDRNGSSTAISVRPTDASSEPTLKIRANGSAEFAGDVIVGEVNTSSSTLSGIRSKVGGELTIQQVAHSGTFYNILDVRNGTAQVANIKSDGSAEFASDVVVGSRGKQWMLVEQGGLCHMVEQVTRTTADLPTPAADKYPELRDVFAELNIVEKALEEVMVKLRMQVPAGWPVWDGSDEISTLPRKSS